MSQLTQGKETPVQPKAEATAQNVVDLLRDLVRAYTKHHGDLRINGGVLPGSIALSVQGHEDDHGKLVGGGGANVWALTTIFSAIGNRLRKPIVLTLLKPAVGQRGKPDRFEPDPNFKPGPTTTLLRRTLAMIFRCPFTMPHVMVGGALYYEVKPDLMEWSVFAGDLQRAVHSIFHAIGKSRGCLIYVRLHDAGSPPLAGDDAQEAEAPVPLRPSEEEPVDAVDAEARERGLADEHGAVAD